MVIAGLGLSVWRVGDVDCDSVSQSGLPHGLTQNPSFQLPDFDLTWLARLPPSHHHFNDPK
jgi:hypothetical protein